MLKEHDRIDELRQYLQQNLHHPLALQAQNHSNGQLFPSNYVGQATTVADTVIQEKKSLQLDTHRSSGAASEAKRMRVTESPSSTVANDSKYKHYSFIPISPGPKSPLSTAHAVYESHLGHQSIHHPSSIFQSPHKSLAFSKHVTRSNCMKSESSNPIFTSSRNDISASAPVSPSIITNQLRFNLLNGAQIAGNQFARATDSNQLTLSQLNQPSAQV